jgi:hypothetical protein
MPTIVTICTKDYEPLLPLWLGRIRAITPLPVTVLAVGATIVHPALDCTIIPINPSGNPFPPGTPDHACAEKLRIFDHLTQEVEDVLFIDVDVLVLNDFWTGSGYFDHSRQALIAAPDLFVGYKEKMEEEFYPFDPNFRMKHFPNGGYFYFNTGVFFAARSAHANLFSRFLEVWIRYVRSTGKYPSIFDQNLINYCLITFNTEVAPMPIQNNCLRQYNPAVFEGSVLLHGRTVNAYHLNGGTAETKLSRWHDFAKQLGVTL